MRWILTPRWLRLAHWSSVALPLLWWPLCYFFWVERGCRPFLPFISDFDLFAPEDTLFTVGVILTALVFAVRIFQLYLTQGEQIVALGLDARWVTLNRFSLLPAGIGTVCAIWLAQVPWNADFPFHKSLADGIFFSGLIWCSCATSLTWRRSQETPALKSPLRWRLVGCLATAMGLLGLIVCMTFVMSDGSYNIDERVVLSLNDPMAYCMGERLGLVDYAAVFEWVLVLGILSVVWTFASEIRVTTESERND